MPTQMALALGDVPSACVEQALFSPDGKHLAAVMAPPPGCVRADTPRIVALFNAHTGHLERTIAPAAILTALGAPQNVWTAVAWSPGGARLAFTLNLDLGREDHSFTTGLLVVPAGDGAPQLYKGTTPFPHANVAAVWDVRAGTEAGFIPLGLQPANAYRWTADGHLEPDTAAAALAGWRNPALGGETSPWDVGVLTPVMHSGSDGAQDWNRPPAAYVFASNGPLWSSDGRFLSFPVFQTALLIPPAGAQDASGTLDTSACRSQSIPEQFVCGSAPQPGPDAGFARVLAAVAQGYDYTMSSGGHIQLWPSAVLAWRPDGKVLAVLMPGDGFDGVPQPTVRITLFDAQSGAVLKTLSISRTTSGSGGADMLGHPPLAWSADGKQLALCDAASNHLTIWQGAALPA